MKQFLTPRELGPRTWFTLGAVLFGLIACQTVNRTVLNVPQTPGAEFVGNEDCMLCHEDLGRNLDGRGSGS
jgi:hypothetical protein